MEVEREYGVLVTLTTAQREVILGVGLSINGVHALIGLWMECDEALDDALEVLFDESQEAKGFDKSVEGLGGFYFNRIVVIDSD